MIKFLLENQPTSLNVMLTSHWAVRSRNNKAIINEVFAKSWEAGWRKSMPKFKWVTVTIIGWRGDKDNAIGGCKPIVDGLWRNDIIPGDSPKECRIDYKFKKGKQKMVRVELGDNPFGELICTSDDISEEAMNNLRKYMEVIK